MHALHRFPWSKAATSSTDYSRHTSQKHGINARGCIQKIASSSTSRRSVHLSAAMETLLENTLRVRASERWSAQRVYDYLMDTWPDHDTPPLPTTPVPQLRSQYVGA